MSYFLELKVKTDLNKFRMSLEYVKNYLGVQMIVILSSRKCYRPLSKAQMKKKI